MPATPPAVPATPPAVPDRPGAAMDAWLRTPRRGDAPGIYTYGHTPRPPEDPDRIGDRRLIGTAVGALPGMWLTNSLAHGYLYWLWVRPLVWAGFAPHSGHRWTLAQVHRFLAAQSVYTALWWALLIVVFGRAGHWPEAARRYAVPVLRRVFPRPAQQEGAGPEDPAGWPQLRAAGQHAAADRLTADLAAGRMTDVDLARLTRAWSHAAAAGPAATDAYAAAVTEHGAAALPHPSGARSLPARTAHHDLMTAQVRLGTVVDAARNPARFRGVGAALDPGVLGTSVVAVGPSGSGKTRHLVQPVVESLCLQALAGAAAVVAVGAPGTTGPAEAFDVVIAFGDPHSAYGLNLYAATTDSDVAAALLSAALLDGTESGRADPQRANTALAQVLGPFRAAHGQFPSVPELRELLEGNPAALATLREQLDEAGQPGWVRELDARARQSGNAGDVGALLANRVALLDRPVFAGFFHTTTHTSVTGHTGGTGGTGGSAPFALSTLERPLRVRVDLPEHGHTQASAILARLLLAQFTLAATTRRDRRLFAALVLDDATRTVTAESVRALQRLRPAHAGIVMALPGLDEVPQALRGPLLGAAGCRIALSGISTWDGQHFAQGWGTAWVEDRGITRTPDQSGGATKRLIRAVRRLLTGESVTTEAVTVRRVERERWSASDLANAVPAGHAVASFTATSGETTPPMLVNLRG